MLLMMIFKKIIKTISKDDEQYKSILNFLEHIYINIHIYIKIFISKSYKRYSFHNPASTLDSGSQRPARLPPWKTPPTGQIAPSDRLLLTPLADFGTLVEIWLAAGPPQATGQIAALRLSSDEHCSPRPARFWQFLEIWLAAGPPQATGQIAHHDYSDRPDFGTLVEIWLVATIIVC